MDEKILKDAQYRKGLSIAFFNATNNAVNMVPFLPSIDNETQEDFLKRIATLRDWLLDEHKNYYATVIANVGVSYRAEDTIAKLKATKTLEELQDTWRSLSEDERHNGAIREEARKLKTIYEKN